MNIFTYMLWIYIYTVTTYGRPLKLTYDVHYKTANIQHYPHRYPLPESHKKRRHVFFSPKLQDNINDIEDSLTMFKNKHFTNPTNEENYFKDDEDSVTMLKDKHFGDVMSRNPTTEDKYLQQTTSFTENTDTRANDNTENHILPMFSLTTSNEVKTYTLNQQEYSDFKEYQMKNSKFNDYEIEDTLTMFKNKNFDDFISKQKNDLYKSFELTTIPDDFQTLENVNVETSTLDKLDITIFSNDNNTLTLELQDYKDFKKCRNENPQFSFDTTMFPQFNMNEVQDTLTMLEKKQFGATVSENPALEDKSIQLTTLFTDMQVPANVSIETNFFHEYSSAVLSDTKNFVWNKHDNDDLFVEYPTFRETVDTTTLPGLNVRDIEDNLNLLKNRHFCDTKSENQMVEDKFLKSTTSFTENMQIPKSVETKIMLGFDLTTQSEAKNFAQDQQEYYNLWRSQEEVSGEVFYTTTSPQFNIHEIEDTLTVSRKNHIHNVFQLDEPFQITTSFTDNMQLPEHISMETNIMDEYDFTAPSKAKKPFTLHRQEYNHFLESLKDISKDIFDTTASPPFNIREIEDRFIMSKKNHFGNSFSENPLHLEEQLHLSPSFFENNTLLTLVSTTPSEFETYAQGWQESSDFTEYSNKFSQEIDVTTMPSEINIFDMEKNLTMLKNQQFSTPISENPMDVEPFELNPSFTDSMPISENDSLFSFVLPTRSKGETFALNWQEYSDLKQYEEINGTTMFPELHAYDMAEMSTTLKKKHLGELISKNPIQEDKFLQFTTEDSSILDPENIEINSETLLKSKTKTTKALKRLGKNTKAEDTKKHCLVSDILNMSKLKSKKRKQCLQRKKCIKKHRNNKNKPYTKERVDLTFDDYLLEVENLSRKQREAKNKRLSTNYKLFKSRKRSGMKTRFAYQKSSFERDKEPKESLIRKRALSHHYKTSISYLDKSFNFHHQLKPRENYRFKNFNKLWKDLFRITEVMVNKDDKELNTLYTFNLTYVTPESYEWGYKLPKIDDLLAQIPNITDEAFVHNESKSTHTLQSKVSTKADGISTKINGTSNTVTNAPQGINEISRTSYSSKTILEQKQCVTVSNSTQEIKDISTTSYTPRKTSDLERLTYAPQKIKEISTTSRTSEKEKPENNIHSEHVKNVNAQTLKKIIIKKVYDILKNAKPLSYHSNINITEKPVVVVKSSLDIINDKGRSTLNSNCIIKHWIGDSNDAQTKPNTEKTTKRSWPSRLPWFSKKSKGTSKQPTKTSPSKDTSATSTTASEAPSTTASSTTASSTTSPSTSSPSTTSPSTTSPSTTPPSTTTPCTTKSSTDTKPVTHEESRESKATSSRKYHVRNRVYKFDIYYSNVLHSGNNRKCVDELQDSAIYNNCSALTANNVTPILTTTPTTTSTTISTTMPTTMSTTSPTTTSTTISTTPTVVSTITPTAVSTTTAKTMTTTMPKTTSITMSTTTPTTTSIRWSTTMLKTKSTTTMMPSSKDKLTFDSGTAHT